MAGRTSATANNVITIVSAILRMIPAAKLQRIPSSSSAPKRWAMRIDKPEVNPITNPRIKKDTLPVHPTAARALTPIVRPTITVSAIL